MSHWCSASRREGSEASDFHRPGSPQQRQRVGHGASRFAAVVPRDQDRIADLVERSGIREHEGRPGAVHQHLLDHVPARTVVGSSRVGLAQHDEVAAVCVAHDGSGLVGFIDDRLERLQARSAAAFAEACGCPLGLRAQRVPRQRRIRAERALGAGGRGQIDQSGGGDADEVAVEISGQLHGQARARGAQGTGIEQDEQAAVRHGGLRCGASVIRSLNRSSHLPARDPGRP
jgi:hypothetical protein